MEKKLPQGYLFYSYPSRHLLTLGQVTWSLSLLSLVTSLAQWAISWRMERPARLDSLSPPPISRRMASSQIGRISIQIKGTVQQVQNGSKFKRIVQQVQNSRKFEGTVQHVQNGRNLKGPFNKIRMAEWGHLWIGLYYDIYS